MAALLSEWAAAKLQLSRPITSMERDLANGFLLGEALVSLGIAPSDLLASLSDKQSVRGRVGCLLPLVVDSGPLRTNVCPTASCVALLGRTGSLQRAAPGVGRRFPLAVSPVVVAPPQPRCKARRHRRCGIDSISLDMSSCRDKPPCPLIEAAVDSAVALDCVFARVPPSMTPGMPSRRPRWPTSAPSRHTLQPRAST